MRTATVALLLLMIAPCGWAQDGSATTRAKFKVFFNFDFRRTFVNAEPIRFYGFRLGAQRDLDMISLGFYGIGDRYVQTDVQLPGLGARELHTDFDYTALTYERLLINTERWQVGLPVSVGLGNYRKSYRNDDGGLVPYSTNELVPIELSFHTDYGLLWWMFIGVGGGYRHVLAADPDATRTLSDWTYYAKAGIRLGEMVKRARTKKKHGTTGG